MGLVKEPGATSTAPGPLAGLKVLDLSRILAGPTATQLLGDLGADVWKIEHPTGGDDTRGWGPPFLSGRDGEELESAYFLCANRNKRSVTIDFATPEGQTLVRRLAAEADVLIHNLKVGGLAKYGLAYADLAPSLPRLIYCSISGFGQTGPRADQAGYDFLIQAMGGIMSLTGPPDGPPSKGGVGVADVMCGMYATVAILAALRHRARTGEGQHVDLALFDAQVAWLINGGLNYLTSGERPRRYGNGHPNIVPYQVFGTADGHLALAVGNDAQFERFCRVAGLDELPEDERFRTNAGRVRNREALVALLEARIVTAPTGVWVDRLRAVGVPAGPVNTLDQVFEDPQTVHREMRITLAHPRAEDGEVALIGNPLKLSRTPVSYRERPPALGAHTHEVLREVLGMGEDEVRALEAKGVC
ncbi:MAG: CaiB/BaiF CoA transferase family protein [Sandaracinaceae bacterium]